MCGNQHCANDYIKCGIPSKYIHIGLNETILKNYWDWVDRQQKEMKPIPKSLFIFDDVLCMTSSKKWNRQRTSDCYMLGRLFNEGRHINASVILVVQQVGIGLRFLRCSDVACFFGSSINCGQDMKSIRDHYLPTDRKNANWILQSCYKHDVIVCEYFRQESHDWKNKIKLFRANKQIVAFDISKFDEPIECESAPKPERRIAPWQKAFEDHANSKYVQKTVRQGGNILRSDISGE